MMVYLSSILPLITRGAIFICSNTCDILLVLTAKDNEKKEVALNEVGEVPIKSIEVDDDTIFINLDYEVIEYKGGELDAEA